MNYRPRRPAEIRTALGAPLGGGLVKRDRWDHAARTATRRLVHVLPQPRPEADGACATRDGPRSIDAPRSGMRGTRAETARRRHFEAPVGISRPRRNRTFSPSFGGSAGHHDSAAQQRLVRELNPSRPIDSGIATPVASRGVRIESVPGRSRTCLSRFRKPLPLLSATRTLGVSYGDCTRLHWVTASPRH